MATKKFSSIASDLDKVTGGFKEILAEIRAEEEADLHNQRRPVALDEQIAAGFRKGDYTVAEYWRRNPLSWLTTGKEPHIKDPGGLHFALNWERDKQELVKRIKATATGQEMSTEEKARLHAESVARRMDLWRHYEEMAVDAERSGLIPWVQRVNMPAPVYLEWDGRGYKTEKLERLEQHVLTREGRMEDIHARRQELLNQQRDIQNASQNANDGLRGMVRTSEGLGSVPLDSKERREKQLAEIEEKKRALSERYTRIGKEYADATRLLNACREFLEKQGVRMPETVREFQRGAAGTATITA